MSIQRDLTADAKAENHKRRASLTGRRRGRSFYVAMSIVAALVVFVGFSRTYYLKGMFGRPPLPLLAHVHGFLFTMWIASEMESIYPKEGLGTRCNRRGMMAKTQNVA